VDDDALARAALARYAVGERLELVRRGENSTYRAGDVALRVHRPGYRTRDMIRSELAWMEALRDAGIATPRVVPARDGDVVVDLPGGRHASALTWEKGAPLAESPAMGDWRDLGRLMAEVHLHGASWTPPAWFVRPAWDREGMVGAAPHWGDPVALGTWDGGTRDLLVAVRERVRDRLTDFGTDAGRYGLVHADLAFGNVLRRDGAAPVVIDFDDCGWSWYLWELAVVLAPFDGTAGYAPRRDALVEGYRARRALPAEDLLELPTFVMARRLVTLGWVFTRADTAHAASQREQRIASFPAAALRYLA